jgi:hypothetical protein
MISTAGIPNGFAFELNALSDGLDTPLTPLTLGTLTVYLSVDRPSMGAAGSAVLLEASSAGMGPADHSADVYAAMPPLGGGAATNVQFRDGDGTANPGTAAPFMGLLEPPSAAGASDDLDAYDRDLMGHPLYFSYGPGAIPTSAPASASMADVLFSPSPGGPVTVFATFAALGLAAGDDLDALILNDADGSGTLTAPDFVAYSLARGSPSLGVFSAADILVPGAGVPALLVSAGSLGLLAGDNLNALSTVNVPEPSSIALLAVAVCIGLSRTRRRHGRES